VLFGGGHQLAIEVLAKPDVGEEARRILVEVEERGATPVEEAAAAFPQPRQRPELARRRFQLVERMSPGVAHNPTLPGAFDTQSVRLGRSTRRKGS
jgi:hypothetical protein